MAQAKVSTVAKTVVSLTMGPKETQSLRNLLARVKKGGDSSDILNLKSIRTALANQGFHRDNANSDLSGVVYG